MSQQLCQICQGIRLEAPRIWLDEERSVFPGQIIPHYSKYSDLLNSARSGCSLCKILEKVLGERQHGYTNEDDPIHLLWYRAERLLSRNGNVSTEGSWEGMNVYTSDPSQLRDSRWCIDDGIVGQTLRVHARPDNIASQYIHTRPRPSPDSDEAFNLIQQWIRRCCDGHSQHNIFNCPTCTEELLPARVIDLAPKNGISKPVLKITNGERGAYVTLSHCWGKDPPTKLTRDNIEQMTQGIEVSTLPRNFQDAILVTQKLKLRYLWIDALCILQDSLQDWEAESTKMGSIYLNSFLTIAAANSADSHSGFLRQSPPTLDPCRIEFLSPMGLRSDVFVTYYDTPVEPLDVRGWCVQEVLLATRLLTYGTYQTFFECRQEYRLSDSGVCSVDHSKSIRFGCGIANTNPGNVKLGNPETQKIRHIKGLRSLEEIKVALFMEWYAMIGSQESRLDYSARRLTMPTDKLPAVSGLAHQVQETVGCGYHAGLWTDSIAYGLKWQRNGLLRAPKRWRAPSWSWASLDGPVKYSADFSLMYHSDIEVLDIDSVPAGQDLLGEVKSAYILLTGRMLSLTCVTRDLPDDYNDIAVGGVPGDTYDLKSKYILMGRRPDGNSRVQSLFLEKMEDWIEYVRAKRNERGGWWDGLPPPTDCVGWCLFDLPEYYSQSIYCLRVSSLQD